ncbi:MAG: phosphatidylserine decarboxylase family protein [Bacteroidota bacterium]|jgi:phosphatidylserine decarboxylase|nr:phosphatidylserine decarboxylase family protein [Bacteroidota bacterium]MEC7829515.1 phosphatidylserine decarboxylase family protein [Bacteroidota bacterium]|tara:strand:+ start:230 stop:874 length:645 start_codon:yes stop_codon:yes gene_type:complete
MFHKEGFNIIIISFFITVIFGVLSEYLIESKNLKTALQVVILIILILVLQFFRNPNRPVLGKKDLLVSPVDGKIVSISEIYEDEYFNDKRLQISIFMSPINVHVTRFPVSGKIIYSKYHPGKYLVAWHPKSSKLNERTTIVIENQFLGKVMYRQIAGTVARRIVNYAIENQTAVQGEDAGFIKFGSRVDIFLPPDTKLKIKNGQKVKGGITLFT